MNHDKHRSARFVYWIGGLTFVAAAGSFLWTEHRAHVSQALPYLPYLVFLACPLLHLFMHGGHGHEAQHAPQTVESKHVKGDPS